mmetsp:Transcript_10790/g.23826  ORF Transcript_10790/g.23826 Transcript_10790/m.23826 type:complete len:493 (-) Transcript_10790:15-1493(-)
MAHFGRIFTDKSARPEFNRSAFAALAVRLATVAGGSLFVSSVLLGAIKVNRRGSDAVTPVPTLSCDRKQVSRPEVVRTLRNLYPPRVLQARGAAGLEWHIEKVLDAVATLPAGLSALQMKEKLAPLIPFAAELDVEAVGKRASKRVSLREAFQDEMLLLLYRKWDESGSLSEVKHKQLYIGQTAIDAYGTNVGTPVPSFLTVDGRPALSPENRKQALSCLQEIGAVRLTGYCTYDDIMEAREMLQITTAVSPLKSRGEHGREKLETRGVANALLHQIDPNTPIIQPTNGRRHALLRRTEFEPVVALASSFLPVVYDFMALRSGTFLTSVVESEFRARPQCFVSEIQLIISDPCAEDQFWHVDNTKRGITCFIPLTDVSKELGATEVLPGSHYLFNDQLPITTRISKCVNAYFGAGGPCEAHMPAGDCLIYDARTVHRGLANLSLTKARAALVFRFDFDDCEPPGHGIPGTLLISGLGKFLSFANKLYSILPL